MTIHYIHQTSPLGATDHISTPFSLLYHCLHFNRCLCLHVLRCGASPLSPIPFWALRYIFIAIKILRTLSADFYQLVHCPVRMFLRTRSSGDASEVWRLSQSSYHTFAAPKGQSQRFIILVRSWTAHFIRLQFCSFFLVALLHWSLLKVVHVMF